MRILYLSSEVAPFSGGGVLAEAAGTLPRLLTRRGHRLTVVSPRHAEVDAQQFGLVDARLDARVLVSEREQEAHFDRAELDGVEFVFVRHREYFDRQGMYRDAQGDYVDNAERFSFFVRAALEYARQTELVPHLVHANDWSTALAPIYVRTCPLPGTEERPPAVLLSIHDLETQGVFEPSVFHATNLDREYLSPRWLEFHGKLNFLKAGLEASDRITAPSRRYAEEIQTEEFGWGLEAELSLRQERLTGILGGVDYGEWNPSRDRFLKANYTPEDLVGKRSCKADLQAEFGLERRLDAPLVALMSRLVDRKGLDLVTAVYPALLRLGVQLVVLGAGSRRYEEFFRAEAERRPGRIGVSAECNRLLAHKTLAGADMLLLPARTEPRGREVLKALRYGAVPLVRATGALDDAVAPFEPATGSGSGFKFQTGSPEALEACLRDAVGTYRRQPDRWKEIVRNALREDNSWERVARDYDALYHELQGGAA